MILKCNFKNFRKSKNHKIQGFKLFKFTKFYYSEINITCAGLPSQCYNAVTFENFKEGFKCSGKLMFSHVKGGVKLVDTEFTIKESKLKKQIAKFK